METNHIDADIAQDDLDFMRGLKRDLERVFDRIEQYVKSGTLREVDLTLLNHRATAMEMTLDEILAADWIRCAVAARENVLLPRSQRYLAVMGVSDHGLPTTAEANTLVAVSV